MKTYLPIDKPECCCGCIITRTCKLCPKPWEPCKIPPNCPLEQRPDREEAREILKHEINDIYIEDIEEVLGKLGYKKEEA